MLYIYTYAVYLISFTLSQNDQNGEQIQKSQMFFCFLFYRMQIHRIFIELTKTTN